jgi:hypothetical protein
MLAADQPAGNLFAVSDDVRFLGIATGLPLKQSERRILMGRPIVESALPMDLLAVTAGAAQRTLASGRAELHRLRVRMRNHDYLYNRLVLPGNGTVSTITDFGV